MYRSKLLSRYKWTGNVAESDENIRCRFWIPESTTVMNCHTRNVYCVPYVQCTYRLHVEYKHNTLRVDQRVFNTVVTTFDSARIEKAPDQICCRLLILRLQMRENAYGQYHRFQQMNTYLLEVFRVKELYFKLRKIFFLTKKIKK